LLALLGTCGKDLLHKIIVIIVKRENHTRDAVGAEPTRCDVVG